MERLQLKKPDHFPLDPYDLDDIYNAANFVLMCAIPGSPVGTIPTSYPSSPTSPAPAPADPTTAKIEALTTAVADLGKLVKTTGEQRTGGQSGNTGGNTYDMAYYALAYQHSAPLVSAPRDAPQVLEPTPPIPARNTTPPTPFRHLPYALQFVQADVPATSHTSVPRQSAPIVNRPRNVSSPSDSTETTLEPCTLIPTIPNAFPIASELSQPPPSNPAVSTLDPFPGLTATLKKCSEALIANQKGVGAPIREPETARSQAPYCGFCRSRVHYVEECEEADKYVLTGKCKRNVFGRIVLPSGAEVPQIGRASCRERV